MSCILGRSSILNRVFVLGETKVKDLGIVIGEEQLNFDHFEDSLSLSDHEVKNDQDFLHLASIVGFDGLCLLLSFRSFCRYESDFKKAWAHGAGHFTPALAEKCHKLFLADRLHLHFCLSA